MNKPKKLSFIERCVYFFDLLAYERRLNDPIKEKNHRISRLEDMLVSSVYGTDDPMKVHDIKQEAEYIKHCRADARKFDLIRNFQ